VAFRPRLILDSFVVVVAIASILYAVSTPYLQYPLKDSASNSLVSFCSSQTPSFGCRQTSSFKSCNIFALLGTLGGGKERKKEASVVGEIAIAEGDIEVEDGEEDVDKVRSLGEV
jgi:hypothetical protein